MKPKLILVLALVLSGGLFGCSTIKQPVGEKPPVIIGQADVKHAGKIDHLYLIWTGGKHWLDGEPSCRMGEKYTGEFIFRIELDDGKTVDTAFDSLGDNMPDYYFARDGIQPIYVDDYNNDGQPDFNILRQRATWRLDESLLFTILPSGKVERLKIKYPAAEALSGLCIESSDGISADEFNLTPKGFYYLTHITTPRKDVLSFLDWHEDEKLFYYRDIIIETRQP